MKKKQIKINYSSALVRKPLTQDLMRSFPNLEINILRAQVSPNGGWMDVTISGEQDEIKKALDWMTKQGLKIQITGE